MIQNPFDNFGLLHFLGDVSAFEVQITAADISGSTAYHSFNLVASSGCKISWGDGSETAWTANGLYTHTYSAAGVYLIQIKGPHTRFYHQTGTPGKVIEAIRLYSGITSGQYTWYGCNNTLFKPHSSYRLHEGITDLGGHFANCNGSSFKLVEGLLIPDSATTIYQLCIGCNGASFTSLPSGFVIPSASLSCAYLFYGCTNLTADISNIFPDWAAGSAVSLYNAFYNAKVTGTAPAAKLWDRTDITWSPANAFSGATYLTNYAQIPAAWGGGGA